MFKDMFDIFPTSSQCVVVFIDSRDLHIQLAIKCILNSNYALSLSISLSQDATNKVISSEMRNIGTFSRRPSALPPSLTLSLASDMEMMFLRLIDN